MRTLDWFYLTNTRRIVLRLFILVGLPALCFAGGALAVVHPGPGIALLMVAALIASWIRWQVRP